MMSLSKFSFNLMEVLLLIVLFFLFYPSVDLIFCLVMRVGYSEATILSNYLRMVTILFL